MLEILSALHYIIFSTINLIFYSFFCATLIKKERVIVHCKVKKVKHFKSNEQWYLPPDHISNIRKTIEAAVENAQYSVDPIEYYKSMTAKLTRLVELESKEKDCICGIKFSGNICYIPQEKLKDGD